MDRYDREWSRGYGRGYGRQGGGRSEGSSFGSWGDAWGTASNPGIGGRGAGLYRQWGTRWEAEGANRGGYGEDYPGYGGYPGSRDRGMYYGGRGGYAMDYDRFSTRQGQGWQGGGRGYPRGGAMGYGRDYGAGGYGGGSYGGGSYGGGYPGRNYGGGYGADYGGGYGGGYSGGGGYGGGGYGGDQAGFDRGYGWGEQGSYGGYDQGGGRGRFLPEDAYRRHPELDRPQRQLSDRWPSGGHSLGEENLSDDEITQSVRQNLHQDGYIDAERIEVAVSERVVTLTGEVDDYLEARYAWDDAWEAAGVRGVVNQLTVRVDKPMDEHSDAFPQTSGGEGEAPARGGRSKKGG